jgi:hypothetical protein
MKVFLEYIAWMCIGLAMWLFMYIFTKSLLIPDLTFNEMLPFMLALLLGISAGYIISHRLTK